MSRPRLYLDVSIIARHDAGTGIQRVVRAIWQSLASAPDMGFEIVPVAGSAKRTYREIRRDFLEQPLRRLPWCFGRNRISPRKGDVFLGLDLSSQVAPRNANQLKTWRAKGVKLAFVVYDLLPVRQPAWFTDKTCEHYRKWLELVTTEADLLACISQTVADDLQRWIDTNQLNSKPSIATMRLGASVTGRNPHHRLTQDAAETLEWAEQGCSILMVGTIEPRKGHQQILDSFEYIWANPHPDEDFQLVIVGRPGWKTEALQHRLRNHRMLGRQLRWIDNADDAYLERLYQACWGVVLASHGEGFGLPVLEAAARNKPLLLRDLPVFREVAPPGSVFFSDESPSGLAATIRRWRKHGTPVKLGASDLCWDSAASDLSRKLLDLSNNCEKS